MSLRTASTVRPSPRCLMRPSGTLTFAIHSLLADCDFSSGSGGRLPDCGGGALSCFFSSKSEASRHRVIGLGGACGRLGLGDGLGLGGARGFLGHGGLLGRHVAKEVRGGMRSDVGVGIARARSLLPSVLHRVALSIAQMCGHLKTTTRSRSSIYITNRTSSQLGTPGCLRSLVSNSSPTLALHRASNVSYTHTRRAHVRTPQRRPLLP